jgi:hypothetical protein
LANLASNASSVPPPAFFSAAGLSAFFFGFGSLGFAISALLMFAGSIAVSAQPATTDLNWTPTAKFAKSEHDFGTVAENGKIYIVSMWLDSENPNKLNVRGYIGIFFRTQQWTRISGIILF